MEMKVMDTRSMVILVVGVKNGWTRGQMRELAQDKRATRRKQTNRGICILSKSGQSMATHSIYR